MTARQKRAQQRVDDAHRAAARQPDPGAFLRHRQQAAEDAYAASGNADELALCHAFEESLNRGTESS